MAFRIAYPSLSKSELSAIAQKAIANGFPITRLASVFERRNAIRRARLAAIAARHLDAITRVEELGFNMYHEGLAPTANPFPWYTARYGMWSVGYQSARTEAESGSMPNFD